MFIFETLDWYEYIKAVTSVNKFTTCYDVLSW